MPTITKIPATISRLTSAPIDVVTKRKVAAYARVSTDSEEQLTSYTAQVSYYTDYIKSRDDWEFVKVYTDEGISGVSTKNREGFQNMVEDALAGNIDLIITKSVSRFARNTVDSLSTIRKLKEHNVECYFEKESIWSFDGKCELLLSIMSSMAQEESRSISENVTWGFRKKMADGKYSMAYSSFLGYDRGEDGKLVVNPEQAETVKLIYKLFLEGMTPYSIAKHLTSLKIPTPSKKEKWHATTIKSILTNEKYKGDALLQKCFTSDFLTKKVVKNEGQIPMYYIERDHEPIIDPVLFDQVQIELKRRMEEKFRYSGVNIFSSKLKCADCGHLYGAKVWQSNTKYRKVIYQCNFKFNKTEKCQTPHLTEDDIKKKFVQAVNQLLKNRSEIVTNIYTLIQAITDTSEMEQKASVLAGELDVLLECIDKLISQNAHTVMNQSDYQQRYDAMVQRYNETKSQLDTVSVEITSRQERSENLKGFVKALKKASGSVAEFDEGLWGSLVEYGTVARNGSITFHFRSGMEINVK